MFIGAVSFRLLTIFNLDDEIKDRPMNKTILLAAAGMLLGFMQSCAIECADTYYQ